MDRHKEEKALDAKIMKFNWMCEKTSLQNELTRTAGTIEAWNYILMKIDHSQIRLRPDVVIKEHYPLIIGRHIQFIDYMIQPLKVSKTASKVIPGIHLYNFN